tara:strand:- start:426 stop:764 length:339 start_codon:yes stop_codon:yes gene_type:complete
MAAESQLEGKLVRYAGMVKIYTRKFTSPGQRSVPDRVFVQGRTLFLEVKAAGKKPTDAQMDEIDAINNAGGFATWVDNAVAGMNFLDSMHIPDFAMRKKVNMQNYWTHEKRL